MLFNSFAFIVFFLPITFSVYFILNKFKLIQISILWLTVASLFFYGYWNFIYIPLILCSITFNFYVCHLLCNHPSRKKLILWVGIAANLALLAYYKYTDFLIANFNGIFGADVPLHHVVLPLGISFFTFTQIAFLVDCYHEKVKEPSFLRYALFVTYFPHLLAGPIIHHAEMMPQFANLRLKRINYKNLSIGLFLFSIGLFKKVVVADFFARFAIHGFDVYSTLSMSEAWITSISYTFQLYFDFIGYTDMAIGISYMFNIILPLNFNSPYKALNIQDFWHRWHMTLSRFLRDYIYIPLGGDSKGEYRTYANVFAVFLLGGLWHGAGWMFIIWGALHGFAMMICRFYGAHFRPMNKFLAWFITFNFINITWIFFRARDLDSAMKVLKGMFDFSSVKINFNYLEHISNSLGFNQINFLETPQIAMGTFCAIIGVTLLVTVFGRNSNEMAARAKFGFLTALFTAFLLALAFVFSSGAQESPFLYFNF